MGKIPVDVVGQAGATAATATQNAANMTQAPQSKWHDVWTQTGSGLLAPPAVSPFIPAPGEKMTPEVAKRIEQARESAAKLGHTNLDGLADGMSQQAGVVADQAAQLWNGKLPDGTSMSTLQRVGAAFGILSSIEQLVTMSLGAIPFPAFPALRVTDMDVGLPHAHMHPPNLIPPNPVPVPLPSTGPVIPIPFVSGASKTLINMMPAARCGDMGLGVFCGGFFPMYEVFMGSANVWIEGSRAGRLGVDVTKHCIFSAPKPSDPPVGPMFGATIMGSANVMIGGLPLPSLTSMAIGAAFKAVFKGVGKVIGAARKKLGKGKAPRSNVMREVADDAPTTPGKGSTPRGKGPDMAANYMKACILIDDLLEKGVIILRDGDDAFRKAVDRDLRKIACTKTGREALEQIQKSKNRVFIEPWPPGEPGNSALAHWDGAKVPGQGSDSTVHYNPTETGRPAGSPPDVGLMHEMGHARNNALGTQATGDAPVDGFPKNGHGMEEYNNLKAADNPYRDEMGYPLRPDYNSPLP